MNFDDLIAKIDDAYPDGQLSASVARNTEKFPVGDDPIADAVIREMRANHDDTEEDEEAQLRLHLDSVDSMVRDLEGLRERLYEMWRPLAEGE